MAKSKKNRKSTVDLIKKVSKKQAAHNPFEVHVNKSKFNVLGQKSKNDVGLPGVSRTKAIQKRKVTLLQEYKCQDKTNKFFDRRIGEHNKNMTKEDRIMARFTAEKMRAHNKQSSLFNLDDDVVLTHQGRTLEEIEQFEDPRSDEEDDEDGRNMTGRLDSEFVKEAHFGGGVLSVSAMDGEQSRKDLISQLIADSKKRKAEKQLLKESTMKLTEQLDTEWKDLLPLLNPSRGDTSRPVSNQPTTSSNPETNQSTTSSNQSIGSRTTPPVSTRLPGKPVTTVDKNSFDYLVKELRFEATGKPSDKLKSEEDVVRLEKEKLEKLERERQKRMNLHEEQEGGGGRGRGGSGGRAYKSADDLDDGFALEDVDGRNEDNMSDDEDNMSDNEEKSSEEESEEEEEEEDDNVGMKEETTNRVDKSIRQTNEKTTKQGSDNKHEDIDNKPVDKRENDKMDNDDDASSEAEDEEDEEEEGSSEEEEDSFDDLTENEEEEEEEEKDEEEMASDNSENERLSRKLSDAFKRVENETSDDENEDSGDQNEELSDENEDLNNENEEVSDENEDEEKEEQDDEEEEDSEGETSSDEDGGDDDTASSEDEFEEERRRRKMELIGKSSKQNKANNSNNRKNALGNTKKSVQVKTSNGLGNEKKTDLNEGVKKMTKKTVISDSKNIDRIKTVKNDRKTIDAKKNDKKSTNNIDGKHQVNSEPTDLLDILLKKFDKNKSNNKGGEEVKPKKQVHKEGKPVVEEEAEETVVDDFFFTKDNREYQSRVKPNPVAEQGMVDANSGNRSERRQTNNSQPKDIYRKGKKIVVNNNRNKPNFSNFDKGRSFDSRETNFSKGGGGVSNRNFAAGFNKNETSGTFNKSDTFKSKDRSSSGGGKFSERKSEGRFEKKNFGAIGAGAAGTGEKLHPSWEAKKRHQPAITSFQGKKIKFE
uniref:Nucleolar protein 14 n=1 Tax=Cacopsylla melanoneura TaxID=428564 RepID=A0A8D9F9H7_9HEMI